MRSPEEVREFLEKFKEIEIIVHPSLIKFGEWVLEEGDPKEQKIWLEIMNGIIDAHRRAHPDGEIKNE